MKKICSGIITIAIIFVACLYQLQAQQTKQIKPEYFKQIPIYRWIDDTHYIYNALGGKPMVVDLITGKEGPYTAAVTNKKSAFVINKNGTIFLQNASGKDSITNTNNATPSPDSNYIAYTKNNDLYVFDLNTKKEGRITTDGTQDVYNGRAAWVYNEEILGRSTNYKAFWWSPDSKRIAFMRFDESKVPVYDHFDDEGVHGKHTHIHYPQPGDPNPVVKIGLVTVADNKILWADFDPAKDQYFGQPYWTPNSDALWVQWMNRRQDSLKIESVDLKDGSLKNIYTETQKTWIDLDKDDRVTFVPSKNIALLMSDKTGWRHIYAYDMKSGAIRQLTNGAWTVNEISYVDAKNNWIYFIARKENSVRTDLYKIKLDGSKLQRLTFGEFNHRIVLSPNASYFITTYSNTTTPTKVALLDNNGKQMKELADCRGKDFEEFQKLGRSTELIRVKTPDGFDLPVKISWPNKIDPSKKYPLMASIYGGPDFSFVQDVYGEIYGANDITEPIIRIQMDHRGSGQFGKMGQDYLYRKLGKWEIEDYVTVIRYLEQKYPFIDSSRIGITGFSYGGYITCLALTKAADVFTYGLAGGSVTDWRLYDSPYTERYMGTPQDNAEGYRQASVMTYVKNYKGLLRLSQGTMDDNVHMQNTIQLVSALQNAGKHFELMLYPGGAHGWLGLHEKYAHYRKEDQDFINKNLLQKN